MSRVIEQIVEEVKEEAKKEAKLEAQLETAKRMLRTKRYSLEEIADISDPPLEKVQELAVF